MRRLAAILALAALLVTVLLVAWRRNDAGGTGTREDAIPLDARTTDAPHDAPEAPRAVAEERDARDPARSTGKLIGTVVEADGAAASACAVVIEREPDAGAPAIVASPKRVACDDAGRFDSGPLPWGRYALVAWKGSLASDRAAGVQLAPGLDAKEIELRLEPAATLQLTVRDAADQSSLSACEVRAGELVAACDHGGRVRLAPLAPGPIRVAVSSRGYAPRELTIEIARRARLTLDVQLARGGALAGVVLDPDRRPFRGARVRTSHYSINGSPVAETEALTDAHGRFAMDGVAAGRLSVRASAPGYAEAAGGEFRLSPGERRDGLELVLTTGGAISGTVARLGGGAVAGAEVLALRLSDRVVAATDRTVDDGSFRFDGLWPGEYTVVAEAGGARALAPSVHVQRHEESSVTLLLGDEALEGRVVDDAGAPVAGAIVTAWSSFAGGLGGAPVASAEDGTFRIEGLVGAPYRLEARASGRGFAEARGVAAGSKTTLVLGASGAIEGVVTDASGRGLTDFVLAMRPDDPSLQSGVAARYRVLHLASPDGRFRVESLPAGRYELRASASSHVPATRQVDVPADATARVELRLSGGHVVSGRAIDGETPASGCLVEPGGWGPVFARSDESLRTATTDADGEWRLAGVAPGRQRFWVSCPDGRYAFVRVEVAGDVQGVVAQLRRARGHGESGEFGGIGASVGVAEDGRAFISSVAEGGPAFLAGVASGDEIVSVDGWAAQGASLRDVIGRIRGPLGVPVALELRRPATGAVFRAIAERVRIAVN